MTARPASPLMPVEEALSRLLEGAGPLGTEQVSLDEAASRVLAEDIAALRTQPPFPASAMDGYAAAHDDFASGEALVVAGQAAAGKAFDGSLGKGQAVRIFTGAPVPSGADAILIQEDADVSDNTVRAQDIPAKGRYIRPAGLDFLQGDRLLAAGRMLDAGALSLAAAANHASVPVVRRPKVGVLATGDELLPPGSMPGPAQIIASNSYGVSALLSAAGADVTDLGIAADNEADLNAALKRAIALDLDLLVTLGGASVGDHDLVRPVFEKAGMALEFWKIAMRPGKPLMFGSLGPMRIVGLPGNPVSSLVCTQVFLVPLVSALGGRRHDDGLVTATLAAPLKSNGDRQQYMRATAIAGADGKITVTAFDSQDSSIISHYANADALIVRPPHDGARTEGETVRVHLMRTIQPHSGNQK